MKMACVHSISLPATGQSIDSIGPIPSELNSRPNKYKKDTDIQSSVIF